ncbi:MAG: hypothetical protein ACMXYG_00870 [Candidatus Woesearchaeota archaeon]
MFQKKNNLKLEILPNEFFVLFIGLLLIFSVVMPSSNFLNNLFSFNSNFSFSGSLITGNVISDNDSSVQRQASNPPNFRRILTIDDNNNANNLSQEINQEINQEMSREIINQGMHDNLVDLDGNDNNNNNLLLTDNLLIYDDSSTQNLIFVIIPSIFLAILTVFVVSSHFSFQNREIQESLRTKLEDYIRESYNTGYTEDVIRNALIDNGWDSNLVDDVLKNPSDDYEKIF